MDPRCSLRGSLRCSEEASKKQDKQEQGAFASRNTDDSQIDCGVQVQGQERRREIAGPRVRSLRS